MSETHDFSLTVSSKEVWSGQRTAMTALNLRASAAQKTLSESNIKNK